MPEPVTARYRARDGTNHLVSVDRTAEGRWRVLDTVADRVNVVETLTGHDDRRAQAQALALDYAAEQQAFELGLRDYDPAPSPQACAAVCASPTAACSPARCRRSATARSSSGCCTPTPPSSSSSPRHAQRRRQARARPEATARALPARRRRRRV